MRWVYAIAITGTLTACGASGPVVGYSASTAAADRVSIQCRGGCGWISNMDTNWKYDARCDADTVLLDPGRYVIGVFVSGCMDPVWAKPPAYSDWHVRLLSGHQYTIERRDGALWIIDKATGQSPETI